MHHSRASCFLVLLGLAAPLPCAGQVAPARNDAPRALCFGQAPVALCRTFVIAEMGIAGPLMHPHRLVNVQLPGQLLVADDERIFDWTMEWSAGVMANLTSSWAFGGVVRLGSGASTPFRGILVRVRRWQGRNLGLDLQAGLLRQEAAGGWLAEDASGFTASARLAVARWGYVGLRSDFIEVAEVRERVGDWDVDAEAGSFFTIMPEVGVTGKPLIAVAAAGAAVFLILVIGCMASEGCTS